MMTAAVCVRSIIPADWTPSACSFQRARLIIVFDVFNTRPRRLIFERADGPSLVFSRFPFIHFAETGNCHSQRAACYHLRIICFYEAPLWFTGSPRPITLSLCKSLAVILMTMCVCDRRYTNSSLCLSACENGRIIEDVLPYRSRLRKYERYVLSGLARRGADLGRKTLSTT